MNLSGRAMALCALIMLAVSNAHAATGTNFSDQWWNPNESGWGVSILQQGDIISVALFVYGADSTPVWFSGSARRQATAAPGHAVFEGDLLATTGPYYGQGTFNSQNFHYRVAGTFFLDFDTTDTGTMNYTVDNVLVSKRVSRQLWKFEDFTGNYYGGMITDLTACTGAAENGHVEDLGVLIINHAADNTIAMASEANGSTCNYNATYSQAGHLGSMQGTYNCTSGISGTFSAFEMERSATGMTARIQGQNNLCHFTGQFGGLAR
jgi:hypothetical protein